MDKADDISVREEKNKIYIEGSDSPLAKVREYYFNDRLADNNTSLDVFDGKEKIISYSIEPENYNEQLKGKFINYHLMVFPNKQLFIEATLEDTEMKQFVHDYEKIEYRVQPVFINGETKRNADTYGLGLSGRMLVNDAYTTPTNVRLVMVCDSCKRSFWIKHYHVGFGDEQFFYSADGKKAAIIKNIDIPGFPTNYSDAPTPNEIEKIDKMLLKYDPKNKYAYNNSFKCKYCGYSVIDFQKHPEIRPSEYYVCLHKEEEPVDLIVDAGKLKSKT